MKLGLRSRRQMLAIAFVMLAPIGLAVGQSAQAPAKEQFVLSVSRLRCEECREIVESALAKLDGVVDVYASVLASEVEVTAVKGKVTAEQLIAAVAKAEGGVQKYSATLKHGPTPAKEVQ